MREILFRGKHIHTLPGNAHLDGGWVEGYLSGKNYINPLDMIGEFLVDENTIGQYTGLTDKNGKKIFEGDILSAHLDDSYYDDITYVQVVWSGLSWCIRESTENDVMEEADGMIWEVCGNIFDNPELTQREETE